MCPFQGRNQKFYRTGGRQGFSFPLPAKTLPIPPTGKIHPIRPLPPTKKQFSFYNLIKSSFFQLQSLLLYHYNINFIHFVHTVHANFDFNQCSIFTECSFQLKGSNGQKHSSSDYHPIETFPQQNSPFSPLLGEFSPHFNVVWKTLGGFMV